MQGKGEGVEHEYDVLCGAKREQRRRTNEKRAGCENERGREKPPLQIPDKVRAIQARHVPIRCFSS